MHCWPRGPHRIVPNTRLRRSSTVPKAFDIVPALLFRIAFYVLLVYRLFVAQLFSLFVLCSCCHALAARRLRVQQNAIGPLRPTKHRAAETLP